MCHTVSLQNIVMGLNNVVSFALGKAMFYFATFVNTDIVVDLPSSKQIHCVTNVSGIESWVQLNMVLFLCISLYLRYKTTFFALQLQALEHSCVSIKMGPYKICIDNIHVDRVLMNLTNHLLPLESEHVVMGGRGPRNINTS